MFEAHRVKKATRAHEAARRRWEDERNGYVAMLDLARRFHGTSSNQLRLEPGEALFYSVAGASLVEEHRAVGYRHEGSAGVSIILGSVAARPVRYRATAAGEHAVQGSRTPTAVDTGPMYVTNRRVVLEGMWQTKACGFDELLEVRHVEYAGSTTFVKAFQPESMSVHYGPGLAASFEFRVDLALAHFRGTVGDLVAELEKDLTAIEANCPSAPVLQLEPRVPRVRAGTLTKGSQAPASPSPS